MIYGGLFAYVKISIAGVCRQTSNAALFWYVFSLIIKFHFVIQFQLPKYEILIQFQLPKYKQYYKKLQGICCNLQWILI